jgi:hypothetical protein
VDVECENARTVRRLNHGAGQEHARRSAGGESARKARCTTVAQWEARGKRKRGRGSKERRRLRRLLGAEFSQDCPVPTVRWTIEAATRMAACEVARPLNSALKNKVNIPPMMKPPQPPRKHVGMRGVGPVGQRPQESNQAVRVEQEAALDRRVSELQVAVAELEATLKERVEQIQAAEERSKRSALAELEEGKIEERLTLIHEEKEAAREAETQQSAARVAVYRWRLGYNCEAHFDNQVKQILQQARRVDMSVPTQTTIGLQAAVAHGGRGLSPFRTIPVPHDAYDLHTYHNAKLEDFADDERWLPTPDQVLQEARAYVYRTECRGLVTQGGKVVARPLHKFWTLSQLRRDPFLRLSHEQLG